MNDFKVFINAGRDETFTTSYQHPLTKRKIRMNFLSRDDASSYKKKVERKFKRSSFSNYSELTIEELLIYFMQETPSNPFSLRKTHLIDFIETFGDYNIYEITTKALRSWLDQIQAENRLKDISMRGLKCEVDTFFVFLKEKEIISESPLATIYYKVAVQPLKSRNLLSPDEIESLLESIRDYSPGYLYPIIKMFAETAAKSAEIIELSWEQLDLEKGLLTFERRNKSQARTIKISDEVVYMLRLKEDKQGRVFKTYYKESFTYEKLRKAINEFKKKNLYTGEWVPADLRHSFAVNFLADGGDMRELQRILGHWNVYDTKKLYGDAGRKQISKEIINPFQ